MTRMENIAVQSTIWLHQLLWLDPEFLKHSSDAFAKLLQNCFQDELILLEILFEFLIFLGLCVTHVV